MENLVKRPQYENRARRTWWSIHIEAWRKSGLSRRSYCRQHRPDQGTFARWLSVLVDAEALRVQTELKREERRLRRPRKLSADMRSRAVQAYWAMHVEAMTWSGMSIRAYAGSHGISRFALGRWRDLIEAGDVEIDWRAQLHPSARRQISTSASSAAKECGLESRLTDASSDDASVDGRSNRRRFSDEEKLAIARESDAPNVSAAEMCRRHGIVTQHAVPVASLVRVWPTNTDEIGSSRGRNRSVGRSFALVLHDLLQPPDGMVAVELPDGRRVFAPADADPDAVRRHVADRETAS
ncbi:IS66 family insertion sequence element accessory protein TnpA [Bradyrhizobium elkanii]|uniref:Transposase-like protein n=1 Tax=Bradyrhizobium elkanii TaxID=29448 RepID=A0A8I1YAM5_BRAEL|nr:transposase [Bradyrhizobium elkanii]MBP1296416.1 transposase-like protein [Bradyrhizobium elkanii]